MQNHIQNRIAEIANKYESDFPNIKEADESQQLYAIESGLDGRDAALKDLHSSIAELCEVLEKHSHSLSCGNYVELYDHFSLLRTNGKWSVYFHSKHIDLWEDEFRNLPERTENFKKFDTLHQAYTEVACIKLSKPAWYNDHLKSREQLI